MLVLCRNCSKEFDKQISQIRKHSNHFCSKSCAACFNNKGKQKNPAILRICKHCKCEFYSSKENGRSRILCIDCVQVYKNRNEYFRTITLKEYHNLLSVKGKHPSWKNSHIRVLNRSWNKDLILRPCAICGYNKHVELCHIKPISSFSESTTIGEINAPSNNIQLCPNCHYEFDHGLISLSNFDIE